MSARTVVRALTGIVFTTVPGQVRFAEPITLHAGRDSLRLTPVDTLFLLTYVGESFWTTTFRGRVVPNVDGSSFYNGACPKVVRCVGRIAVRPQHEWWVKVRDASGREGWTNEADAFDGRDALSGQPEPAMPAAPARTP